MASIAFLTLLVRPRSRITPAYAKVGLVVSLKRCRFVKKRKDSRSRPKMGSLAYTCKLQQAASL